MDDAGVYTRIFRADADDAAATCSRLPSISVGPPGCAGCRRRRRRRLRPLFPAAD